MASGIERLTARLLSGAALCAVMAGGPANAQDPPAADEEARDEIVVEGFRRSLQQSIAVKRDSTAIVDAITADDIADFPDLNLAEALQRIPGVQIDRDGGEGRSINVRGLSSDFVRVQLNGLEALSTTGGRDGRANRNRQFDFNIFAAELFNSVTVAKSQEASTDEGSLGATVGLRSAKPFDYKDFTFSVNAQAAYNDLSEEASPRIAGLISDRFMDGRLGVLFSGAWSKRDTFEEGSSSGRFRIPADDGCVPTQVMGVITSYVGTTRCYQSVGTITTADGQTLTGLAAEEAAWNAAHPRIPRYGRIGYDRERLGLTGSVQFEPWDSTRFTYDIMFARLDQTRSEEFLEIISFARETGVQGFRAVDLVSGVVDDNATLISGVFNDVDVRSEQRIDILETEFIQQSLEITHDFSERFRVIGLGGYSRSTGKNPQQTTISLDRYDVDGYSYDYSVDKNLPIFDYGFDVNDPTNWALSSSNAAGDPSIIRQRPNKTLNSYEMGKLDFEFDATEAVTITVGGQYKKFGFDVKEWRTSEAVQAVTTTALANAGIPQSAYTTVLDGFGNGLSLPPGTPTSWIIPDLNALNDLIDFDCNCINSFGNFLLSRFNGETRSAFETSWAGFLEVAWNQEIYGMPFRGNAGFRFVDTSLETTGILSGAETTVENSYTDFLPAVNLVFEPMEDFLVRFAAAKTMARPNLASLTPGGSVDANPPGLSLNTGNPFLEPIRSNNLDLSFEWYPYSEALFAVALFRKNVDSFVQRLVETKPYSETGFPDSLLPPGVTPQDNFVVTTFLNTPGGVLKGIEVTLQTPFSFLPAPFDDFGFIGNFTAIDSEFEYITNINTGATVTNSLVGQSPKSASGTFYYDNGPLEARISATYRDEYLTLVPAASGNDVEGKASTLNLDFSASYDITDRLEISFEAINLTNQADERWINSVRQNNLNYEVTGREFFIGARFSY